MTINTKNRAILMGVSAQDKQQIWGLKDSILELQELSRTAGVEVVDMVLQNKQPDVRSYLGQGKLQELKDLMASYIGEAAIDTVIADDELKPSQQRHLEKILGIKVIDRTRLILDIFAQRAKSRDAQIQVELAQLEYSLPRLTHLWTHLSRLGGGVGTKGPGETQLEVDKRQIKVRILKLKRDLEKIQKSRALHRHKRTEVPLLSIALVGYTNSGKSTLFNTLTDAKTFAQDLLFATLDPLTRQLSLPDHKECLLTDTVGFIQKLPHSVIEAFKSTLEESIQSDLLWHVVDASHPHFLEHIKITEKILMELKIHDKDRMLIFNKADQVADLELLRQAMSDYPYACLISAQKSLGISELLRMTDQLIASHDSTIEVKVPYSKMEIHHLFHQKGHVIDEQFLDDCIQLTVKINRVVGGRLMGLLLKDKKNNMPDSF